MPNRDSIQEYSDFEDQLIKKFEQDRFFTTVLPYLPPKEFTRYLLQLGNISFEFVKFLERAKLGLATETGKEAIRQILRDEIPPTGPTHQDSRVSDLLKMGVPLDIILKNAPTKETSEAIKAYYEFIRYPKPLYDVRVIVFVRVIGEVLVGTTYKHVVQKISNQYLIPPEDLAFYTPHWKHDIKGGTGDASGKGHTEYYDEVLVELISERTLHAAKEAAKTAANIRTKFNAQSIGNWS